MRYARAIDVLTKLKTEYPFSPQLTDAELKIGDAYYLNQHTEAINAFKEFQSMHPTNENIAFVIYRLGQLSRSVHLHRTGSKEYRDRKGLLRKRHYKLSQIAVCEPSARTISQKRRISRRT